MEEKRTHPRVAEQTSVNVTVMSAPGMPRLEGQAFLCTTDDLSAGGLRFNSPEPLPVGAVLGVQVSFAGIAEPFAHVGCVAWVKECGDGGAHAIGVDFIDTSERTMANWKEVLEKKLYIKNLKDTSH